MCQFNGAKLLDITFHGFSKWHLSWNFWTWYIPETPKFPCNSCEPIISLSPCHTSLQLLELSASARCSRMTSSISSEQFVSKVHSIFEAAHSEQAKHSAESECSIFIIDTWSSQWSRQSIELLRAASNNICIRIILNNSDVQCCLLSLTNKQLIFMVGAAFPCRTRAEEKRDGPAREACTPD